MIRKIDKYNRVSIPREMQKLMGLKSGQAIDIQYDDNKIIIYPRLNETIRTFMVSELKNYEEKLNEEMLKDNSNPESITLFNGLIIELERLLDKYDKLY